MAQLRDDCFAFSGRLLPLIEMERLIAERVSPVAEIEEVALAQARKRVVADDLLAAHDLPPFDNSAVDGYAVCHRDLSREGETRLVVTQRVLAGAAALPFAPGTATRIFTGALLPAGADTVFMQEDCRRDGDAVIVPLGLARGANSRFAGEDVPRGAVLLPAGRRLTAPDLALAAADGVTRLAVRRRLRVAVFSTGDEVIEPGGTLPPATVFDANRQLLHALLEKFGAEVSDLGILRDTPTVLQGAIAGAAAEHDLVITSGGVSTGEADHVREAIEAVGRLVFWRVAIKPGRPVAMGVIRGRRGQEGSAAFAGLPGNPAAVYVTFVRVVRPLLMRLAGAKMRAVPPLPVRAAFAYKKRKGRREYVRVSLRETADGMVQAIKFPRDGAGVITSLTETDGLVELGEEVTEIAPGATVRFLSHAALTE
jgi:molybdopterin molybdotransferase